MIASLLAAAAITIPCGLFTLRVDSVAPGVYAAYQAEPFPSMFYLQGNTTIVVGANDAVVVDAGASPAAGRCLVEAVKRVTPNPVRYLVNTHWHGDHTLGNQAFVDAFPGVQIIASAKTRDGETGDGWKNAMDLARSTATRKEQGAQLLAGAQSAAPADRDSIVAMLHRYYDHDLDVRQADYRGLRLTPPTRIVDSALTLQSGNRTIRIYSIGKGDAPGTLVVYLPKERVLASADLVVAPVPFGYTQDPMGWRETLARIDSLPFRVLIPGHGDPRYDHAYVRRLERLVDTVIAEARRAVREGRPADSVSAQFDARALARPFTGGSPTLQFFFEQYFLEPFSRGSYAALKDALGRSTASRRAVKPSAASVAHRRRAAASSVYRGDSRIIGRSRSNSTGAAGMSTSDVSGL